MLARSRQIYTSSKILWDKYKTVSLVSYVSLCVATYVGLYVKDVQLNDEYQEKVNDMFQKVHIDVNEYPNVYRFGKIYIMSSFFEIPRFALTTAIVLVYARTRKKIKLPIKYF